MRRLGVVDIALLIKAHCAMEFGQVVYIHHLVFTHGRWDATVQGWNEIVGQPVGPRFGMLLSKEGELLEDALDTDDAD